MIKNFITKIHTSTKRDFEGRMLDSKVECMRVARKFDVNFFDGDRRFGYGGYVYDGRWIPVAKKLIKTYKIGSDSRVLDIGCGKGFLAKDIQDLSGCRVDGCDISKYALDECLLEKGFIFNAGVDELRDSYDLIISLNTLHNLLLPNLKQAIQEINTHSKKAYIVVESYRNEQELYNLQCWGLTCEQFLRPEEWEFLLKEWGYKGDYEFIFFS